MSTYKFYFGRGGKKLHKRIDALHAEVVQLTRERDSARSVAEIAVDVEEAVEAELRAVQEQQEE